MGWLLWMFFVWFLISRFARRRRRWMGWYMGPGGWAAAHAPCRPRGLPHQRAAVRPAVARELSPRERRELTIAELRRRYVADDISVEEYEAGLDRVLHET